MDFRQWLTQGMMLLLTPPPQRRRPMYLCVNTALHHGNPPVLRNPQFWNGKPMCPSCYSHYCRNISKGVPRAIRKAYWRRERQHHHWRTRSHRPRRHY